jgi:dephospho-CoA kinase
MSDAPERMLRPAWCVTLLAHAGWVCTGVLLLLLALVLRGMGQGMLAHACGLAGAVVTFLALLGGFVLRLHVRYGISPSHVWARVGLLGTRLVHVPRAQLQHTSCTRSALERIFGVGSVALWTSGGQTPAVVMRYLEDPEGVLRELSGAQDAAQNGTDARMQPGMQPVTQPVTPSGRFLVIGLVGSIGAGKSEAARVLAQLGCVVIDADKLAKDALLRDEVKAQLRSWWGDQLFDASGNVDRARLAQRIFADSEQRQRLEALVHPIVHETRAAEIARARSAGKPGVVIDAPLLFEAGSERFCDYVLCIDAPREVRVARVVATRGWSEQELAKREAAQISIAEKRERSHVTIDNDSTREALRERVLQTWQTWQRA